MLMDLKELKEVLNNFGKAVVARSKKKLKSGPLSDSLKAIPKENKNSISLSFLMEEYGLYKDLGVQGKSPSSLPPKARKHNKQQAPLSPYKYGRSNRMPKKGNKGELYKAVDRWVAKKGIKGSRNKLGQFTKRKSMVFLISRSIYFAGLKPSLFFTTPFRIEYKKLPKEIANSFAKDVVSMVQKIAKT
jgi:hypothetical protein